ncbi:MAG: hypothetical protein KDD83_06165 [Caldilineaceae bacterium]|nr:hypothetical protein [Caldilineaceae bacterium]
MDYGKLLGRAFTILRERPFLIILGILSSFSGSGSSWRTGGGGGGGNGNVPGADGQGFQFQPPDGFANGIGAMSIGVIIVIAIVVFLLILLFWLIGVVAQGGLVAGVNDIEERRETGFSQAWSAGWQRKWPLLGINLLPAIPMLLLLGMGILAFLTTMGIAAMSAERVMQVFGAGAAAFFICSLCLLIPITIILAAFAGLAIRACMLEQTGVFDSYRRAWRVISDNLGEAVLLVIIQIGLGILLAVFGFLPGLMIALCCILWPLLLIIGGAISAYVSSLWTLAWREWTGASTAYRVAPPAAM